MKPIKKTARPAGGLDFNRLKTYSIRSRKNLVNVKQFCRLTTPPKGFKSFIDGLPDILAGSFFRQLVDEITRAYKGKYLIGAGVGTHVIKCGLSPVIIDLMKKGIIKAVAMNGAGAIHDYEISLIGATSEDVGENIKSGKFGMAKETAAFFVKAGQVSIEKQQGLGKTCGQLISKEKNRYTRYSIMAEAFKLNIPLTIHVALGTDTIHMHPLVSGANLGAASLSDFKTLASLVAGMNNGVWLNIGSAVILPEVFLKAVSVARNLGYKLDKITTANLDMIQHYRPVMNVTGRTVSHGINLTGHHEIMLPLLRWSILSKLSATGGSAFGGKG
ncbi:MAG: hypothetical protein HY811_06600 [Planctomycetes bacterium]|nr:hypothetical protein [Planctomycetota bacterium]